MRRKDFPYYFLIIVTAIGLIRLVFFDAIVSIIVCGMTKGKSFKMIPTGLLFNVH